ncbi:hypothetical protein EC968_002167 [Mortierella alpina]|nr:hypothetical protein EC968_002167 [Mortierella alpina]
MTPIPSPASLTTITSTAAVPTAIKKPQPLVAISTSPTGSGMDDATMDRPHASPSSTSSSSPSLSSSSSSSPVSSTFSLPATVAATSASTKGKGKAVYNHTEIDRDRALLACSGPPANHSVSTKFCTTHQSSDASLPTADEGQQQQQQQQQQQEQQDGGGDDKDDDNNGKRNGKGKGKGKSKDDEGTTAATVDTSSDMYTHSSAGSSNSSSLSTLSSVEEESDEQLSSSSSVPPSSSKKIPLGPSSRSKVTRISSSYGESSSQGSSSGSAPSRPRVASSAAQSSSSHAGGSGSGSKPALTRAATGPASFHHSNLTAQAPSSALPQVPNLADSAVSDQELNRLQDFRLLSYDAIPEDFDFGDLPFYDTDPMTGIIYGDPHAITRPYLVPEMYYDHYRLNHDSEDPRRTNVFNKHGTLLYYHPGRHIGQEQDSLRSQLHNQPMWTMAGRSSTWGTLTATEMATKRQIKIVQEINKKKAAAATAAAGAESTEPLSRFVFRWKEDDFVVEYRKVKDQHRITCSQMCGGKSKWRPPQANPTQTMFHGIGMEGPGNPYATHTIGTPSPFDPTRYLQLISEYRLNSGPVHKRGDFELYNPDTFPAEFRSFLVLLSIVILDVVRPVDDKLFYKEFPQAATKSFKVAGVGGLRTQAGALAPTGGHMGQMAIVGQVGSASASVLHTSQTMSSRNSPPMSIVTTTSKSAVSVEEASTLSDSTSSPSSAAPPLSTTLRGAKTAPVVSGKKSRWANIFKKS